MRRRTKRSNRKPSFFWQGVLILAPMLVLAKLGAYALWKDQRLALHEAEGRARDLAEEAAGRIWGDLEKDFLPPIQFDQSGKLLNPKPYDEVPLPRPLNEGELNAEQRRLWTAAQQAFAASNETANLRQIATTHDEFLRSDPPRNFAAVAHFNRAVALEQMGQKSEAAREFRSITTNYADTFSEAGLPLDFLARAHVQTTNEFVRYAIENPCSLTPQIVAQFSTTDDVAREVRNLWANQEVLRRLADIARSHFSVTNATLLPLSANSASAVETIPQRLIGDGGGLRVTRFVASRIDTPAMFWVTNHEAIESTNRIAQAFDLTAPARLLWRNPRTKMANLAHLHNILSDTPISRAIDPRTRVLVPERNWLLIRVGTTNGFALVPQPELQVFEVARTVLSQMHIPEWLDFTISVAGRNLSDPHRLWKLEFVTVGKGSGQDWRRVAIDGEFPLLGTGTRAEHGKNGVTVSAWLVSRDLLLHQQQTRAFWFGAIIAVAAAASIVGFVSAYRAFHKQHRLAELKSNFVSSVSHELRAPIASIRLMAEGLERGKIAEQGKQHDYFRFMVQECRRLSSMIENVLDFARIEQGRKEYEFEPVDVAALVQQTVKLMEPYAAERGVQVVTRIESAPGAPLAPELSADPASSKSSDAPGSSPSPPAPGGEEGRPFDFAANLDGQAIQQALVNLIDNAIKHSAAGEEVVVALEAAQNGSPLTPALSPLRGEGEEPPVDGRRLVLSVKDHGPGIPAAEQEKIFERFYRLGSELRRETPGVGIGLSIVKHIVEAHRGRVTVDSAPGKGSRFTIELPIDPDKKLHQ